VGKDGRVQIRQPNWVVDGFDIDVKGQGQYGVEFSGNVSGSVLANSDVHDGTFGAGVTTYGNATGATIENNHIHHFSRGNLDSHGIVVQTTTRDLTIRNNDIHDNSGDSVQCLGPEGFNDTAPADGVLIENNHLFSNRENGIDVKTCRRVTIRNNRIHGFAPTTTAKGDAVVVHYSAADVTIEGNEIFDASKGVAVGGNHVGPVPKNVVIARNRIHGIKTKGGGEGTGIRIENSEGARVLNNTLDDIAGTALILGHGTGGATSNGLVVNNVFMGATLVNLGSFSPGLKMNSNLYARASGKFTAMQAALDFEGWKARGLDTASTLGDLEVEAVDQGSDVGLPFCGKAPDLGAFESGC
ncbi:MAG: right-handed parallel beta-helix repeat-containing protein, partial [Myxococcaceae bacterium]